MRRTGDLDAKDREILALLEADARRSVSEIGRLTGLSAPTVTERIARLQGHRRHPPLRHPDRLREGRAADGRDHRIQAAHEQATPRPTTSSAAATRCATSISSPASALMILIVRVADNVLLNDLLRDLTQYGETKTSVILNTIDEWRPLFRARFGGAREAGEGLKEMRA